MYELYDTYWGHLAALRHTILTAIITLLLGCLAALAFHAPLIDVLLKPLQQATTDSRGLKTQVIQTERVHNTTSLPIQYSAADGGKYTISPHAFVEVPRPLAIAPLLVLGPLDGLWITFKVMLWGGVLFSAPMWFYLIFSFVSPALYRSEKKPFVLFLLLSSGGVLLNGFVAYYTIIPYAIQYLVEFNSSFGQNFWSVGNYLDFVLQLLLAVALATEGALLLFLAVHFGWIPPALMAQYRRHAIVIIFIVAAVITPPDVLTQLAVAIPLVICYELALLYGLTRKRVS